MENIIKNSNVSYSAIVLDDKSAEFLYDYYNGGSSHPEGWEWIGHHVTIKLGPLNEDSRHLIGKKETVKIFAEGKTEKVFAVKVEVDDEIKSIMKGPKFPHITLAVNRSIGGKPVDSNYITDWKQLRKKLELVGTVQEILK